MNNQTLPKCSKVPEALYRIGVFSQMNKVTIKTLRHYDDIGLLKPHVIDESNGYRYYTSQQLPKLHQILALKEIGFSLDEIQSVIDGASEEKLLLKKKSELLSSMAELGKKIAGIESYLIRDTRNSGYHVITKSLPEVIIASMRIQMSGYQELFERMPQMGLEMEKAGCECAEPDYCFTIYHDEAYRESDIDAQICQAVTESKEDTDSIQFTKLPKIELAACTLHKGPYYRLPEAYSAIIQFIEESGYEIIGHQRESYIDGVWNKDSPEDWLTEIQFPIREKQSD